MTRSHAKPVVLADYKAQKMTEAAISVTDENGNTHVIPPPAVWSDDVTRLATSEDPIGAAEALMGEAAYTEFVAGGGSAAILMGIIEDELGASLGE